MKKLFLFSLLVFIPSLASAYDVMIDGICYNLNSKTQEAEACGVDSLLSGDVIIPSIVSDGMQLYHVTSIGEKAFYKNKNLTSIDIPITINKIGDNAFVGCDSLSSVYISDLAAWCRINFVNYRDSSYGSNPLKLAPHFYLNGEEIKDLVIPEDVGAISDGAFYGYQGLETVTISETVSKIGVYTFCNCSNLTSVYIPSSLNFIGYQAFYRCEKLSFVNISDVAAWCRINFQTRYGYYIDHQSNPLYYAHHLYMNGEEIKDLVIPDGVTSIHDIAFILCEGLESVTISKSVESIGEHAFSGCSGLTSVVMQEEIYEIFQDQVYYIRKDGVSYIDERAFGGCSNLTSVSIPSTVTKIDCDAFNGCYNLTAVNISDLAAWCKINFIKYRSYFDGTFTCNPLYYAHHLYLNGEEIIDMVIPDSVATIGAMAFCGCQGLKSVTFSENVSKIEDYAFLGCNNMTSVYIPSTVKEIGLQAFEGCESLTAVNISDLSAWCKMKYQIRGEYFTDYYTCNPLFYAHHLFINGEEIKDMIIPDSVSSITPAAFYNCTGLATVEIPDTVKYIGDCAFWGCDNLLSVYSKIEKVYDINYSTFDKIIYNSATLYVPEGTLELYQQANGWKNFSNITGIALVRDEPKIKVVYQNESFHVTGAEGSTIYIYDVIGHLVLSKQLTSPNERIPFNQKGIHPVIIHNKAGVLFEKKLVTM